MIEPQDCNERHNVFQTEDKEATLFNEENELSRHDLNQVYRLDEVTFACPDICHVHICVCQVA